MLGLRKSGAETQNLYDSRRKVLLGSIPLEPVTQRFDSLPAAEQWNDDTTVFLNGFADKKVSTGTDRK